MNKDPVALFCRHDKFTLPMIRRRGYFKIAAALNKAF